MTYVIAEPCVGVKDATCTQVCPVECIHTSSHADMYFIDPDECIDCGVCVPECPVEAIYTEKDLPNLWDRFLGINSEFFKPDDGMSGVPVSLRPLPPHLDPGTTAAIPVEDRL